MSASYHPIIEAFLKARSQAQEDLRREQEKELATEQLKERARQYDETQKRLQEVEKNKIEYQKKSLDLQKLGQDLRYKQLAAESLLKGVPLKERKTVPSTIYENQVDTPEMPSKEFVLRQDPSEWGQLFEDQYQAPSGATFNLDTPEQVGKNISAIKWPLLEKQSSARMASELAKIDAQEKLRMQLQSEKQAADEAKRKANEEFQFKLAEKRFSNQKELVNLRNASNMAIAQAKNAAKGDASKKYTSKEIAEINDLKELLADVQQIRAIAERTNYKPFTYMLGNVTHALKTATRTLSADEIALKTLLAKNNSKYVTDKFGANFTTTEKGMILPAIVDLTNSESEARTKLPMWEDGVRKALINRIEKKVLTIPEGFKLVEP